MKAAVVPDVLPNEIFRAIGKCHLYDMGNMAISTRIFVSLVPYNALARAFSFAAPYLPDYKKYNKTR